MTRETASRPESANHPLASYRFRPGQSGNPRGRPKGSRNKLSGGCVAALQADWLKHGAVAIERLRETDPGRYVQIVAGLIPRELLKGELAEQLPSLVADLVSDLSDVVQRKYR
jgi:uncharacterized protein DUF5681